MNGSHQAVAAYIMNLGLNAQDTRTLCSLISVHEDPSLNTLWGQINQGDLIQAVSLIGILPIPGNEAAFIQVLIRAVKHYNDNWQVVTEHVFNGLQDMTYS